MTHKSKITPATSPFILLLHYLVKHTLLLISTQHVCFVDVNVNGPLAILCRYSSEIAVFIVILHNTLKTRTSLIDATFNETL